MTLLRPRLQSLDYGLDSSVASSERNGKVEHHVTLRDEWGQYREVVERAYDRLDFERSEERCLRRRADEGGDVAG